MKVAKIGFLAKFWKIITIGTVAAFGAIKKFFFGSNNDT